VRVCFEALNAEGKAVKGARVLILGLAYKANVDDDRESPSYKLIQKLEAFGATVAYHDPFVPVIPPTREHAEYAGRRSVDAITADYDLILLSTGHDEYRRFDFASLPIPVVDTRNAVAPGCRPAKYYRA
ncbi:MAG: UDP binding domain-containing protein, partial [Verrucomicrobiota bacterium]